MLKKAIFYTLITAEFVLVFVLAKNIRIRNKNVLGLSISPINKKSVITGQSERYKYYYEPEPSSNDTTDAACGRLKSRFNRDTFNEVYNYGISKRPGTFRIETLGDSFTMGICVAPKDNWSELLETELNSKLTGPKIKYFEVLNLGVDGYDLEYSMERYGIRGQKYNPDMVIFFVLENDFNIVNEYYLKQAEFFKTRFKTDPKLWEKTYNEMKQYFEDNSRQILSAKQRVLEDFINRFGKKIILVEYDIKDNRIEKILDDAVSGHSNAYVIKINKLDPYMELPDGHPNEKGHRIISDKIFDFVKNNGILN